MSQHINNLKGLNKSGFQNENNESENNIFEDNETVELLRPIIKKYFSKAKGICRVSSSYGLKHTFERHLGTYVANGELIYAMHLEGFKLSRDTINCFFNIKASDIKILARSKTIIQTLLTPTNYTIDDYIRLKKRFNKYKYHFKLLIHTKFPNNTELEVIQVVAKEISESAEDVKYWFNLLKFEDYVIPEEKMKLLEILFNSKANKLINNLK